jgi:hypothetical protein
MSDRFANVQLAAPPPDTLYLAVRVVAPGVSPMRTAVALARCWAEPAWINAFASDAVMVLAPVPANDMKHAVELALPISEAVRETNTLPEAGIVTLVVGPTVVRST